MYLGGDSRPAMPSLSTRRNFTHRGTAGRISPRLWIVAAAFALTGGPSIADATPYQLSLDAKHQLVSVDLFGARWAIVRNVDDGSVTGNIFNPSGGSPTFVWCTQASNDGTTLGLSCYTATSCPVGGLCNGGWQPITNIVALPLSLFERGDPNSPPPPPSGTSPMRWELGDGCNDGTGLWARFFDETNNLLWPNSSQVYFTNSGGTVDVTLTCYTGAKICYGARRQNDQADSYWWGVDINNDKGCPSCCYNCADTTVSLNLVCP